MVRTEAPAVYLFGANDSIKLLVFVFALFIALFPLVQSPELPMYAMRTLMFATMARSDKPATNTRWKKHMNAPVVRMRGLCVMLDQGKSTIYAKLDPASKYFDGDFPRPIALSNSPRGAKAWLVSEVEAWLELRAQKSRARDESSHACK